VKFIILVRALVTLLFQIGALQAGMMETIPVGEEVYQWIYEYLDELYARGLINQLPVGTKPYFLGMVAEELLALQERVRKGQLTLNRTENGLKEELENEFASEMNQLKLEANSSQNKNLSRKFL
jgi:hypothetical protein